MDNPGPSLVASYVAEILERAHSLQRLAEGLANADEYVSPEAPQLIRGIAALAIEIRKATIGQWNIYRKTHKPADLVLLRGIDGVLRTIAGELRIPARAVSEKVPGVLTRLVAKKAAEFVPNAGLILRPQWNYNFKIDRSDVHSHYKSLLKGTLPSEDVVDKCFKDLKRPLYVISFPLIERSSVHLHSVLGHELGHLMARDYAPPPETEDEFLRVLHEKRIQNRRRARAEIYTPNQGSRRLGPQQLSLVDEPELERAIIARRTALKEFAADAASVFLFGIAAIFGAVQVAISRNLRGRRELDTQYYPTWGTRLLNMLDLAEGQHWFELDSEAAGSQDYKNATKVVQTRLSEIKVWVREGGDGWRASDPWVSVGHESAQSLLPHIHAYLNAEYQESFADRKTTYQRLPLLFDRLVNGLPPDNVSQSEVVSETPTLADIFAASWWYRLYKVAPNFRRGEIAESSVLEAEKLRRLTLKAIENVDLVDRFRSKLTLLE